MSFIHATEQYFSFKKEQQIFVRSKDVLAHNWLYDRYDLQEVMSYFQTEEYALARIAEMGGIEGLAYALRTDSTAGLGKDEVEGPDSLTSLEYRRDKFGRNTITRLPPRGYFQLAKDELGDPMLMVLIVAGLVSIIIGAITEPHHGGWIDGFAILVAVCIVVNVGALNNYQKEKQFRAMELESDKKQCIVLRNGKEKELEFEDVVVGDLVVLRAGFAIPADGIFVLGSEKVKTDEAGLTGESTHITKNRFHPLLMKGTQVIEGEGLMLALAVGDYTEWGQLMTKLQGERADTPLQEKLEVLGGQIGWGGAAVAVALFLILLIRWAVTSLENPEKAVVDFFIIAVTIVVVAVPEGLPLAVTISLAYSMRKMIKDNNFVRHHDACETMGNATTICSDKTGTLTQNLMSVTKVYVSGNKYFDELPSRTSLGDGLYTVITRSLILNCKAFYSDVKIDEAKENEKPKTIKRLIGGNQTECALMQWAIDLGEADYTALRQNYPVTKFFPFNSAEKRSSVLVKIGDGRYAVYTKGAAEWILELCSTWEKADGSHGEMDEKSKTGIKSAMSEMTKSGLRCLGVAYKEVSKEEIPFKSDGTIEEESVKFFFEDMIWVSVCGIQDRVRPEVPNAVRTCQKAGIVVRMVTGDHLDTACHIARECHIYTKSDHIAMTGAQFGLLSDEQKDEQLPKLRVLARAKPSDKEELVAWYKSKGDVVAVTGDGANDAPALSGADVGLAMGIQGTDVAKEAADIIIMDDNFASIVLSVMWGRSVFDNIKKFVQFQLTVNVVALTISLIGAFFKEFQNPLTAVQLLWVNLIMDTMAALALATEPPSMDLLKRNPYIRDTHLISKLLWRFILGHSVFQLTALLLTMFLAEEWLDMDTNKENDDGQNAILLSLIFNLFVWMQIFNEINARKVQNEWNVFEKIHTNAYFVFILIITVVLQVIIVEAGGAFTSTKPLNMKEWGYCIGVGAIGLVWGQVVRLVPVDMNDGVLDVNQEELFGFSNDKDENEPVEVVTRD